MSNSQCSFAKTALAIIVIEAIWNTADGANVVLICPGRWRDGTNVTLTCHVDALMINRQTCPGQFLDAVDFQFTEQNGASPSPECQVSQYLTQCQKELSNSAPCHCKGVARGRYIFEFTFTATQERHKGGSWMCLPTCRDTSLKDPLTYNVSSHCVNISFTASTDFKPLNQTQTPQTCDVIDCSSERCSQAGCIGIVVGSTLLCVILVVGAVIVWHKRKAGPPGTGWRGVLDKKSRANTTRIRMPDEALRNGSAHSGSLPIHLVQNNTEDDGVIYGSSQNGLPQSDSPQNGSPQNGSPQNGSPQDGPPQNGSPQNGSPQDGLPQNGSPQNGSPQNGSPQDDSPQDGSPQDGSPQDGSPQSDSPQDGSPQDGLPQSDSTQNGSPQNGSVQDGSPQDGPPQNGSPQNGLPQGNTAGDEVGNVSQQDIPDGESVFYENTEHPSGEAYDRMTPQTENSHSYLVVSNNTDV